jgi:YfiH family protein
MDDILRPDWRIPGVVAFTTLRHAGGSSSAPFDDFNLGARCGDTEIAVAENRARLISKHALPSPPRWLRQVHGTCVIVDPAFDEPDADAAVTCAADTTLAILTADCLPVVFAARDGSEVAAAHAGWRGLAGGILEATVAAMQTSPDSTMAWLGPAAGPQAYEVGQEVFDAFVARDALDAGAFQPTRPGHWNVDLYALARRRLASVGVTLVAGGDLCTVSDPQRFFSHRRDQHTGRMATIVYRR